MGRAAFLFLGLITISLVSAQNSMIVRLKDGSSSGTLVSSTNKITFSGGNLLLKKNDASVSSYLISDINKITFGLYSGISEIVSQQTTLSVYPCPARNSVQLKNTPEGQVHITIYNLAGIPQLNCTLNDGTQAIDISNLPKGLYLLKANNKTLKFTKQ